MAIKHSTTNETSFALAYMDATTLVLDGLAVGGSARATKFEQAKGRLETAIQYTSDPVEQSLALQLTAYIRTAELFEWNRQ